MIKIRENINRLFALSVFILIILFLQKPLDSKASGIPVVDVASLSQEILQVVENTAQTLKMIEQYKTQLEQYQVQLQNSLSVSKFIWPNAKQAIDQLIGTIDTVKYYKNQVGSIEGYLEKFQDAKFYENSNCFKASGCSTSEQGKIRDNMLFASEIRKKANDAMIKSIELKQDQIRADAIQLKTIQTNSQSATGQLQAMQYATQIAGNQANQLMHIRTLLVSQQDRTAALMQSEIDKDSQEYAAKNNLRRSFYQQSTDKSW